MTQEPPIRRALVSVSDRTGLEALARGLASAGIEIVSTGGTAAAIRGLGIDVTEVAHVTGFPEILGGRVKTLHPMIHGGLLGRPPLDSAVMAEHGIAPIGLLVVNLYPFEAAIARGASDEEAVETIDIGGPAMIRAAAKNAAYVAVVADPADYGEVLDAIAQSGMVRQGMRRRLAAKAFALTARYDAAVAAWMASRAQVEAPFTLAAPHLLSLRYGENPHQGAALYAWEDGAPGVPRARLVQGKPLSYNNIADADAALELVCEFAGEEAAVVIVKHMNPCGAALGRSLEEAHQRALACDPVSAFGGIVAVNRPLDGTAARAIAALFTEVVVAPQADEEARAVFAGKPNLRLLLTPLLDATRPGRSFRSVAGGVLVQDRDGRRALGPDLKLVTKRAPTPAETRDLLFAATVAKHVKSNAIVFARDSATVGIGAGQMSRVDAARIAVAKAEDMARAAGLAEPPTKGAVLASDAFFPFADGVEAAAAAGATAVIQPGGSLRDAEVIAAADAAGLAMVFTGLRHFRH